MAWSRQSPLVQLQIKIHPLLTILVAQAQTLISSALSQLALLLERSQHRPFRDPAPKSSVLTLATTISGRNSPAVLHARRRLLHVRNCDTLLHLDVVALARADVHLPGPARTRINDPAATRPDEKRRSPVSSAGRARNAGTAGATHLPGAPDLYAALLQHHLPPVREPPHDARDGEEHGEEVERETWGHAEAARSTVRRRPRRQCACECIHSPIAR